MQDRYCLQMVACDGSCGNGSSGINNMDILFDGIANTEKMEYDLQADITQYRALVVECGRYYEGGWVKTYDFIPNPHVSSNAHEFGRVLLFQTLNGVSYRWYISWHFSDKTMLCCDSTAKKQNQNNYQNSPGEDVAILKIWGLR